MAPRRTLLLTGLDRWLWRGLLVILIGLPFHAFGVTWWGSFLPARLIDVFRLWYEAVTILTAVGAAWLAYCDRDTARRLWHDPVTWLIAAFAALHLAVWLIVGAGSANALLALKVNLEFLVVYLSAQVLAQRHPDSQLAQRSLPYILIPAAIVAVFGLIQLAAGSHDLLRLFGFDPNRPNQFVVDHTLRRLSSTIWGPNQLGSYLVLPIMLSLWLAINQRLKWAGCLTAGLVIVLFGSQSRGAWLAVGLGAFVLLWRSFRSQVTRVVLLLATAALSAMVLALIHFHPLVLEHGTVSNAGHLEALTKGVDRIKTHSLGAGLEAAGKASENTEEKLYTENFYLQIAAQVGWEGLALFVAIVALVGWRLWRSSAAIATPLLAALLGLSVNNLVAHTWSDAATAMIWWGVAGLMSSV